MLKPVALISCLACSPIPATAETLGTISASLDGVLNTWFLTSEADQSQSGWTTIMPGSLTGSNVTLWGNPDETQIAASRNALVLGAILMPGAEGILAIPEIQFLEEGYTNYWTTIEEDPAVLSLSLVEVQEDGLQISGEFEAKLYFSASAAVPPDLTRSRLVSGMFEATLPSSNP